VCTVTGVADEVVSRPAAGSADWWRPTRTLATWLTWLLLALGIVQLVYPAVVDDAPTFVRWHAAFDALLDGHDQRAQRIFDEAQQDRSGLGSVQTLLGLATLVLLIVWTWRSVHNTRALGRTGARLAPGWAIAAWFIPIANFVLLYLIFSDLLRSSDPAAGRGDGWRRAPGSGLVRVWVVAYVGGVALLGSAIGLAAAGVTDEAQTRGLLIAGAVVAALGTFLSIVLVRRITERQETQQAADPAPTSRPIVRQLTGAVTPDGPGWYPDPARRHDHRYWDGTGWTEHVSTAGVATTAPVTPPDWYPDPTGRFDWRYWTGHEWTEHVSRDQELFVDPIDDPE
jgi:hypothetical protein